MTEDAQTEMIYVRRDAAGEIVSVSLAADSDHGEAVVKAAGEVHAFLRRCEPDTDSLARSDTEMSRVVEDLIDLLINKDVISFTDLPAAAQAKLLERRRLRSSMTGSLLLDDEGLI